MDLNSNPLQFGVKMLRLKYVTNFLKKEYQAIYHSIYGYPAHDRDSKLTVILYLLCYILWLLNSIWSLILSANPPMLFSYSILRAFIISRLSFKACRSGSSTMPHMNTTATRMMTVDNDNTNLRDP